MPTVVRTDEVDAEQLAARRRARADVVVERADGDDRYVADRGPFRSYERRLDCEPLGEGRFRLTETTSFRLAIPLWGPLFVLPIRREMRRVEGRDAPRQPWWAPPDAFDARSAEILGLLSIISIVVGYLGTLLTQTLTFAADEFRASTTAQSTTLAAVRVGVLLALVLVARADRLGRRRLLIGAAVGACATAVLGAVAPSLVVLGATQAVSRGLATTGVVLITIVAAEEMPAGSRAYAVSVMTMAAALGGGMALWALPLADLGTQGWRLVYLIPVLGIPVVLRAGRALPESKRFVGPHAERATLKGHMGRLGALCATFLLISAFAAPASQLLNEFLKDERGFSGGRISLFIVLTTTPAGVAIVVGGRVADVRGRRRLVVGSVVVGAVLTTLSFASRGWPMWVWSLAGTMAGALSVPALGMYGPELFPTGARGRANGVIQTVSVVGSALGLLVAGIAADRTGSLARGMAILVAGPLIAAAVVWRTYPETAHRELEELNPEDAAASALPSVLP
ncbi:MAG: MFS transporter [Actinobacteria bacterium]|nr:MFS transporter [Actinomycetota bacterium]